MKSFCEFPAEALDATGVQVSHKYKLPMGWNEEKLHRYIMDNYFNSKRPNYSGYNFLRNYLKRLKDLNPELKALNKYRSSLFDILMGVASRYNVVDIEFWLQGNDYSTVSKSYKKKVLDLYCLGYFGGFLPAPATVKKIYAHVTPQVIKKINAKIKKQKMELSNNDIKSANRLLRSGRLILTVNKNILKDICKGYNFTSANIKSKVTGVKRNHVTQTGLAISFTVSCTLQGKRDGYDISNLTMASKERLNKLKRVRSTKKKVIKI